MSLIAKLLKYLVEDFLGFLVAAFFWGLSIIASAVIAYLLYHFAHVNGIWCIFLFTIFLAIFAGILCHFGYIDPILGLDGAKPFKLDPQEETKDKS